MGLKRLAEDEKKRLQRCINCKQKPRMEKETRPVMIIQLNATLDATQS
jgi:hypothetical protein